MLSGETAAGKYPIESVKVMAATIKEAEKNIITEHRDFSNSGLSVRDIEKKVLIKSAIYAGEELGVTALFVFTKSGKLARLASSFRPNLKVYAFTMNLESVAYMNTLYGIHPYLIDNWNTDFTANRDSAIKL
jgi:pyruvate kinase